MRQVKCQDTGVLVSALDAWKAPNGKYYSSQGAFEHLVKEKEYRQKCMEKIGNILGYTKGQKFPTIVAKKLKEYETYGYDTVYQTILGKEQDIYNAISNKDFASEYNKTSYIMAIITNSINDFYKKKQSVESSKQVGRSTITMEEIKSIPTSISNNTSTSNNNVHDISRFL